MCAHCAEKDSLIRSLKQANSDIALFLASEKSRQGALDQFADDIAAAMLIEKCYNGDEATAEAALPALPYVARQMITIMH